jgi:hypothetical protein
MSQEITNSIEWLYYVMESHVPKCHRIFLDGILEIAKEKHRDEIEAAAIISSAEQSTSAASSYAEGYTAGYKRAVDYMTDTLKNTIQIKENGSNNSTTSNTTGTTRLCTVFVPNQFVFQNRCKNCGNERHQHIIPTNTK